MLIIFDNFKTKQLAFVKFVLIQFINEHSIISIVIMQVATAMKNFQTNISTYPLILKKDTFKVGNIRDCVKMLKGFLSNGNLVSKCYSSLWTGTCKNATV